MPQTITSEMINAAYAANQPDSFAASPTLIQYFTSHMPEMMADILELPLNLQNYAKAKLVIVKLMLDEELMPADVRQFLIDETMGLIFSLYRQLLAPMEAVANGGPGLVSEEVFMQKIASQLSPEAVALLQDGKLTIYDVLRLNPELIINNN